MQKTKINVQVIQIPYDSGHRSLRAGRGPEHLIDNGITQIIRSEGNEVFVETVESQAEFRAEVQTQFELYSSLAKKVAEARRNDKFPLILSGNCGATLGAIAGAGTKRLGVIWFDAHGEFNTPETTTSGFLDGMGLAVATGLCWRNLAASIPGFSPIPGSNILLIGGRDFDEGERERLTQAGVIVIDTAAIEQTGMQNALHAVMPEFMRHVDEAHLHIDLDALNPREAPANSFVTENSGLSVDELSDAIQYIRAHLKITSTTIASFDPKFDPQGKTLGVIFKLVKQILDSE